MNDWSDGYVTEVDYTYGFYKEMAPAAMRFALMANGIEAPPLDQFAYCELGYGQGAGLALLAAANPQGDFWGTDFNPAHTAGANKLATECGLQNLHVFDDSFEQFVEREMPQFDYITLHGVYSWVGAENCKHIVNFIRSNLKVGGAVYISYNTLPGWTHALPMRGLLSQYVHYQTSPADTIGSRLDGALQLLSELNEVPGSYFMITPQLADRIKTLKGQSRNYLAHEYLNRHWTPVFFSQMVDELAQAKLTFAAHANPLNCIDTLNHTKELQAVLDKITNPVFREVVRDLGINQAFRRDIFVRGPRRLSKQEHSNALLDGSYALVQDRAACALKVKTTVGEASLQPAIYEPVLDRLAKGPLQGRSLSDLPAVAEGGSSRLAQVLIVLVGAGYAQPTVPVALAKAARTSTTRFNEAVIGRTLRGGEGDIPYLASPMLGSGVVENRLHQLFMLTMKKTPSVSLAEQAKSVWGMLARSGQVLIKDGKTLEGVDANMAELQQRLTEWQSNHLPIARHLGVLA